MQIPQTSVLKTIYGETKESSQRFESLYQGFEKSFGEKEVEFFSAPGRTEIIGNHTDHNGGKILAASIDMDTIGAACPTDTNTIEIISEGYRDKIIVNLDRLESVPQEQRNRLSGGRHRRSGEEIRLPGVRFPGIHFHTGDQLSGSQLFRFL